MNPIRFSLSDYENHIRAYVEPRYPDLVEPYRQAAHITDKAIKSGQLSDDDLAILVAHASNSKTVLSDNVGGMLTVLATHFPSALRALEQMTQSSKVGIRVNALMSLPDCAQIETIYAAALQDKSKKVRGAVAVQIWQRRITALLPALDQAIQREQDAEERKGMQWCRSLFRDGYWLETNEPAGVIWVTVVLSGSTTTRSFPLEQFETQGKAWMAPYIAEWKKICGWPD